MTHRTTPLTLLLSLGAAIATGQVCELEELATISTPGTPTRSLVIGSTAYVAAGSAGLLRIDVADPEAIDLLDATATPGPAVDIAYEYFGNQLVVAEGVAGIGAYTVPGSGPPVHLGTTNIGGTVVSLSGSAGDYVAGSQQGTLYLVTLGDDDLPVVEGELALSGQVVDVLEHSRRAYCALGTANAVAVVDVLNRSAPTLVAAYNLPGAARSLARTGDLLLVGVEGTGLVVFQIRDTGLVQTDTVSLAGVPTEIVVWNERVFMVGPQLGLAEADPSLGTDIVPLARLELPGSAGLALIGSAVLVGRGSSGFTSADASACSNPDSSVTDFVIPAGARAPGSAGSFWLTDVALTNFSNGVATANLAYLAKNQDNSHPRNASLALGQGEQVLIGDVFFTLLGLDSANGGIRVSTSHPDVKITSRTYNAAGEEGTYGQFIGAQQVEAALTPNGAGGLNQLQENEGFRTNIGVVNLGEQPVDVEIHLYHASGSRYGIVARTLLPYEMTQYDRIFNRVNAGVVDSGFAVVKVLTTGGEALAYASVVDNGSNDPIYIPAQRLSDTSPFSY
jgi:hypothetical protein